MTLTERTVILPLPPSANIAYRTDWRTKRRVKTARAEAWIAEAEMPCLVAFADWEIDPGAMLAMHFRFAFPTARRADAQSYVKLACDTIVRVLGRDDNHFVLPVTNIESLGISRDNPRCEVLVQVIGHRVDFHQRQRRKKAA